MDELDRKIINSLQGGFPVCEQPYAEVAWAIGTTEEELIARIKRLLEAGILTRFGPLFDAEKLGGAFTLAAMEVPIADLDRVAGIVNGIPEVAHNYQREHALNLWFVLATEKLERIDETIREIEQKTGYPVHSFPKLREFYVGLRFEV